MQGWWTYQLMQTNRGGWKYYYVEMWGHEPWKRQRGTLTTIPLYD